MSVKIVSDGTFGGTTVLIDGVPQRDVTGVSWSVDSSGTARATIDLIGVEIEAEAVNSDINTRALYAR